ncbi:MAG: amidohydrolase family protein, partial [Thermoanaerobaculales bacterium]|nr:amidohydrolase family protein [Thermoanaerobaculales bacterium]
MKITSPDDWHLHLRDGAEMADVVGFSARAFSRAVVMPNLAPAVTTTAQASAYRERIVEALPDGVVFEPLMTLYLTDLTSPAEIESAAASRSVVAVKLYPAGATTNSEAGVTDLALVGPVLEAMVDLGMPLLVHGEVTDPLVDVFDREKHFIDKVLGPVVDRWP